MIDARKDIIFRDENYKEKFRIKDGESIKITVGYDGREIIGKCRYLDDTHFYVANQCFHADEFKEKMMRLGNKYGPLSLPEPPMIDIVIAELGEAPRDAEVAASDAAMRELLGGEVEIISVERFAGDRRGVYVRGADGNGAVAVCGIEGDNITSLHPNDARTAKRELAERVRAADAEKPKATLAERLEAGKAKAAAHNAGREAIDNKRGSDIGEH